MNRRRNEPQITLHARASPPALLLRARAASGEVLRF
jgi:hypothetical protein